MKAWKICAIAVAAVAVLTSAYFSYIETAFTVERTSEPKHLKAGDDMDGECLSCHWKATAKIAQYWYEGKHGVMLVRCQTCHGMPDGSGANPFSRAPGKDICARCHIVAIERMEAKFGSTENCSGCHPNHQSPMHNDAYQFREPSTKTEL